MSTTVSGCRATATCDFQRNGWSILPLLVIRYSMVSSGPAPRLTRFTTSVPVIVPVMLSSSQTSAPADPTEAVHGTAQSSPWSGIGSLASSSGMSFG